MNQNQQVKNIDIYELELYPFSWDHILSRIDISTLEIRLFQALSLISMHFSGSLCIDPSPKATGWINLWKVETASCQSKQSAA